jgi:hypothetical protein
MSEAQAEKVQAKSLYQDLVEAGVEVSNWQSDLYFPITPQTTGILRRHPEQRKIRTMFTSGVTGKRTYEVPFAYDPFWERCAK